MLSGRSVPEGQAYRQIMASNVTSCMLLFTSTSTEKQKDMSKLCVFVALNK